MQWIAVSRPIKIRMRINANSGTPKPVISRGSILAASKINKLESSGTRSFLFELNNVF